MALKAFMKKLRRPPAVPKGKVALPFDACRALDADDDDEPLGVRVRGQYGPGQQDRINAVHRYFSQIARTPTTTDHGYGGSSAIMLVTLRVSPNTLAAQFPSFISLSSSSPHESTLQLRNVQDGIKDCSEHGVLFGDANGVECTWSVGFRHFRLCALFELFAGVIGVPVEALQFVFEGRPLEPLTATPGTSGFRVGVDKLNVVDVSLSSGGEVARRVLECFARIANVPISTSLGKNADLWTMKVVQALAIGDVVFSFLRLDEVVVCSVVSTWWHMLTCKYALAFQLKQGGLEADVTEFASAVERMHGQTSLVNSHVLEEQLHLRKTWQCLSMAKEQPGGAIGHHISWSSVNTHPFSFCKAAGCTTMATCELAGLSESFRARFEELRARRCAFFGQLAEKKNLENDATSSSAKSIPPPPTVDETLDFPGGLSVVEATTEEQRSNAIAMFRQYFSPDMYYVFPLMVYRGANGLLDFRNCSTWVALDDKGQTKAALTWRMHFRGGCPSIAEVLFIATWEEQRGARTGALLVHELERVAREMDAECLYVEVGFEQPLARQFWGKKGFQPVRSDNNAVYQRVLNPDEVHPAEAVDPRGELVMGEQWHVFAAYHCLRFQDTQQFVKLL